MKHHTVKSRLRVTGHGHREFSMKLSELISELKNLESQLTKDPDVTIDFDYNGYWDVEYTEVRSDEGEVIVNIKSSNEV